MSDESLNASRGLEPAVSGARAEGEDDWVWSVDENGLAGYGDNGPNFSIKDDDGDLIATLPFTYRLLDYGETPQYLAWKAAAHLIAAAPDLLDALQNLLAVHEGEGGTRYHAGDIARAAIAKALSTSTASPA